MKIPVMLTFDLDAETLWLSRDPNNAQRPVTLSQGHYGAKVGAPRILDLLEKYDIRATWFIPAWTVEKYADLVRRIAAAGHEIGHHGDLHEWPETLGPEREREVMERGLHVIEKVTGQRPVGYRSPAWEFSPTTLRYLLEYKFLYSSNFMDDDAPYVHQVDGKPTGLVELPVGWHIDDAPFALYNVRIPGRNIHAPSAILEIWQEEFAGLYDEGKPLVLTMHPQLMRPFRARLLEEFIRFAAGFPGVAFERCRDVAERVRSAGGWPAPPAGAKGGPEGGR